MLKLSSGRSVFFEGIVSVRKIGNGIQLELATKEKIDLANVTEAQFMKRRSDYFQELQLHSTIGEALTLSVLDKLQLRIEDTINTLDNASTGYKQAATDVSVSSKSLVKATTDIVSKSGTMFEGVVADANNSAKNFKKEAEKIVSSQITPTVAHFKSQVELLSAELTFMGE